MMGTKLWLMALRPKTMTAAIVPVVVATALVKASGHEVIWWVSICALLSAAFIQIGTNLINDVIDFKKGADTSERIGPRRVTQSGLLSSSQVMKGAVVSLLIAFCFGIPLVAQGGWPIVLIGLTSLALGYGYTAGPFPLAYNGLGDLFVIIFFGLVAVMGTFYLHTGEVTAGAAIAGLQIGFLATVLIAINNLRDAAQDSLVGKKTLAVRFGALFSRVEIVALAIGPFVLGVYWYKQGEFNAAVLPILSFLFARRVIEGVLRNDPGPIYNRFLGLAAALHLSFGLLLAVGFWMKR